MLTFHININPILLESHAAEILKIKPFDRKIDTIKSQANKF